MSTGEDRLLDLEADLEAGQISYLRQHGWRHTSITPDCVWMWAKDWKGQVIMVDLRRAIAMQRHGFWS